MLNEGIDRNNTTNDIYKSDIILQVREKKEEISLTLNVSSVSYCSQEELQQDL